MNRISDAFLQHISKQIIESSSNEVYWVASNGRIIYANEKACSSLGYTCKDLIKLYIFDIDFFLEKSNWYDHWYNVQENGHFELESKYIRKNGTIYPVQICIDHIIYEDHEMHCAFVTDISKQKKIEQDLKENEVKYKSMMEAMQDFVYICSDNYQIEYMNPALIARTGFDATGELCYKALHNRNSICPWCVNEKVQQGQSYTWEVQSPKDKKYYSVVNTPIKHHNGSISKMSIIRDISNIKNTENRLFILQNYLQAIIDYMPSIIITVDKEKKINQWNLEAEKRIGISCSNIKDKKISSLPFFHFLNADIEQAIKNNKHGVYNSTSNLKSINIEFADIDIYPLYHIENSGAIIRIDDVSNKVRMEEIMVQADKMRSLGGLAAGMAHEINNPLAGVLQSAQLLQSRLFGDLKQNYNEAQNLNIKLDVIQKYCCSRNIDLMLDGIIHSGQRAVKIVDNMLSFCRTGNQDFININLREILDSSIELIENDYYIRQDCDFSQIHIIKEYHDPPIYIYCDIENIRQVIFNIIKNAVQAMINYFIEKKMDISPTIILRTKFYEDIPCIEIQDNGPGMDKETRKRAFDPFFTTKDIGQGSGLGLFIAYFIIEKLHKGQILIESSPGKGTLFRILIPQPDD